MRWAMNHDPWEKLVGLADGALAEADRIIAYSIAAGVPALHDANFVRIGGPRALEAYENILVDLEAKLDSLCARHAYRQLLSVCRMCAGLPALRSAEAKVETRLRANAAARWVLKRGGRLYESDYFSIEEDGYSIGEPDEALYADAVKIHRLAAFHQRTLFELMRHNFARLVASSNGLPGPAMAVARHGNDIDIGFDASSSPAYFAARLFEHREIYNSPVSFWGVAEAGHDELGMGLIYNYSARRAPGRPYNGGIIFEPDIFYYPTFLEHAGAFSRVFERDVGMPVEHFWSIMRGLGRLGLDVMSANDYALANWGCLTGTLHMSRNFLSGGPLEEAASHALVEGFPDRGAHSADLGESVRRFVDIATAPPPGLMEPGIGAPGAERADRSNRLQTAADVRLPAYPYMIYGDSGHETLVVDYLRTMTFVQGVLSEMRLSEKASTTCSRQNDAYRRTAAFDRRLAELLSTIPGVSPSFVGDRVDPREPNVEFRFDSGRHVEIDVPIRVGDVLVAVQTFAWQIDPRTFAGDHDAIKRRWTRLRRKLRDTDQQYTSYLLEHPEGQTQLREEGLACVLPVLCSPYAEPAVSLDPERWLRLPPTAGREEADRAVETAVPRTLTPTELLAYLGDKTEDELAAICERHGWTLRRGHGGSG